MRNFKKNTIDNFKKSKKPQKKVQNISRPPDVTENRISGQDLLKNYFIIAKTSLIIIYQRSLSGGQFEYVNPAALDITGYTPDEFYRKPGFIENILHPLYREQFNDTKNERGKGHTPHDPAYHVLSGAL